MFRFLAPLAIFLLRIPLGAEIENRGSTACFWGKPGERTTYSQPYRPTMAPEIPYGPTAREQEMMKRKLPMTPEEALTVVMSDGCSYRVYYKESIRYRPVTEYKMVFEPIRKTERVPVEQINPYTGTLDTQWYDETTESAFPVLHEKEVVSYVPEKVLLRVFISEEPSTDMTYGATDSGSATLRFQTDVTPR